MMSTAFFAIRDLRWLDELTPAERATALVTPEHRVVHDLMSQGAAFSSWRAPAAVLLPWIRVVRLRSFVADAERADAAGDFRAARAAWTWVDEEIEWVATSSAAQRALCRRLVSAGLPHGEASARAVQIRFAFAGELAPIAHARALLRRWPAAEPDDMQAFHAGRLERWMPDTPASEPIRTAMLIAALARLAAGHAPSSVTSLVLRLARDPASDPDVVRTLVDRVTTLVLGQLEAGHHWVNMDPPTKVLTELGDACGPHLGVARVLARVHADAAKSRQAGPRATLEHAARSVALLPLGEGAAEMASVIQHVTSRTDGRSLEASVWFQSFVASDILAELASYRSEAAVRETTRRVFGSASVADHRIARAVLTGVAAAVADGRGRATALRTARAEAEVIEPGAAAMQWAQLEQPLAHAVAEQDAESFAEALPAPKDVAGQHCQATAVAVSRAKSEAETSAPRPKLRRALSYVGSAHHWPAKAAIALGLLLVGHAGVRHVRDAGFRGEVDGAFAQMTASSQAGDPDAALDASLQFIDAETEAKVLDPRHREVAQTVHETALKALQAAARRGDGARCLEILERTRPYLEVSGQLERAKVLADEGVLAEVTKLALAQSDADAEALLERRQAVLAGEGGQ